MRRPFNMSSDNPPSNPTAPYQLYYFPIPGRAEGARVALSLANLDWNDNEIMGAQYAQMKKDGELPWGLVPILQTPDGTLGESTAIMRYIGNMAGLTPKNAFQAAKVDEFLDGMEPFSRVLSGTFSMDDVDERTKARQAVFNADGDGTKSLKLLQTKISQSTTGWAANTDHMSIADIMQFDGVTANRANNDRINGWNVVREYLEWNDSDKPEPRLKIFENCKNLIRTLPMLVHSEKRPEDLDTKQEDHSADALRYGLMYIGSPSKDSVKPYLQRELEKLLAMDSTWTGIRN